MNQHKENFIRLQFYSLPENVAIARVLISSLVAQGETTLTDLEEIKVAVSEAVSNSVIHGYKNKSNELITIEAYYKDGFLKVIIEDNGIGIEDIEQAMAPTFTTDPERMGLGFVFMQSFMDNVKVISTINKGTKVILEKNLLTDGISANVAN